MSHEIASPLAGKTVTLKCAPDPDNLNSKSYRVEDWWDRVAGKSWQICNGNPACLKYAIRSGLSRLPIDDEVLYGKVGLFGHLVHISEIVHDA